ncbi:hypothetical protein GJV85_12630 [Sulfurimonas aquatica]|uniref:Uncharacterized protein n=1 Tax=Sulfurimonas aquatica TaxID=2672570 RepID=A0A975B293_9BACT|nr:hypothetical protein [Sulfurimonas aquatica]QSZ42917.1 hypothetical protein GJV85_12630 [Sulfurimonas aquatica]
MSEQKFIDRVVETLGLKNFIQSGKRKSVKNLLKKLKKRRLKILKSLKDESNKENHKECQEELDIITLQIQKGKKILNK